MREELAGGLRRDGEKRVPALHRQRVCKSPALRAGGQLPTVGVRGAGGWSGLGWGEVGTTRGRGVRETLGGDCAGAGGAEAGGQPA